MNTSPFAKLQAIPAGQVRFTTGFLADRLDNCITRMVPVMGELMQQSERVRYVGNFEVAAGIVEGRHRGPKWNDGDFYKWLEAAAAVYAVTRDAELDRQMDAIVDLIAKTQDADGYIHTDVQIAQKAGESKPRFGNPMDFEMYNHGHLITAACVHHLATGKRNLLDIALMAAEFLARQFAQPTPDQARHGICPAHLMALADLYRLTGDQRHMKLAARLLDMRDLVTKGDDDNQDRIPFRQQTTAHGHAVRATYLYAGAADVYLETGDRSLLDPLEPIWRDLTEKKLYITGGCGALYDGASPDGAIDQTKITRVHQAFGREFQLPHSTAHNETCAAIGNLFFNWRMFLITGESRYADLIEHTFYNSVLAGVSLDGTAYFYTNTLRQLDPMPCELRWPRHRQRFMSCFCCPPNVVRTVARLAEYAYAQSDDAIYTVLYGGSTLQTTINGSPLRLTQASGYPWDGKVRLSVDQTDGDWSLRLRIPQWSRGASVSLNGKGLAVPGFGQFYEIRRRWMAGDVVEIDFPLPVQLMEANPYVEEARNQLAVMRGPIVYCLESLDLPAGVRLTDVLLSRHATFTPQPTGAELAGVTALRTQAVVQPQRDWSNQLYRNLSTLPRRAIDATLIPYFAWDNRGETEMTVWIPAAD